MKDYLDKSRSFFRIWILSLFLLLGLGAPSFFDSPIASNKIPAQTEQKESNQSETRRAYPLPLINHFHHTEHSADSFADLTKHHSNISKLRYQLSKTHVLPLQFKLGSQQILSDSKYDDFIYLVG